MIKIFFRGIRGFKKEAFLAPFFVLLEVIVDVLIPVALARVIDNGVKVGDMNYIVKVGLLMLVMSILSLLFGIISGYYASKASMGFARNLRSDMFKNIQSYSFANIDKFSTSSIITRLTMDISYAQMSFQMMLRIMFRAPMMMGLALVLTFYIDASLASIFLFAIPFLSVVLFLLIRNAFPNFKKMFKKYDELNLVIGENLHGIRTVKSFVREEEEIDKFKTASADLKEQALKAERFIIWNGPVLQLTVYVCIILISLIGGKLVIDKRLEDGELTSFFTYIYQILMNLNMLSMVLIMFAISKPSINRISEILEERSDIVDGTENIMEVTDGSIVFENVSFGYDESKMVLKNIDLTIESGQVIGIIGGTGSAKSTFVNLLSRLYDVSSGRLIIGGHDVRAYNVEALRNQVAVVLQKNVLFSGTIKENLQWGNLAATDEDLIQACKLAKADDFINDFPEKYDTVIDQGGLNVSGGQKQRLCIARALLKNPRILVLDDSTSAVDTKTDALIRRAFKEYIPNVTKIIVAQRIASIEDADQIIVLEQGQINGVGNHQTLLRDNKIYKEVYESQVRGVGSNE